MYFLNKGAPWVLQVLPSLLSFFWKERIFLSGSKLFKHLHWFCFISLREHYVWAFRATLMFYLSCSQPNKLHTLGFHSTINLLLSMEMCRNWWGNHSLAWADRFFSAISLWWTWPVQPSWRNPKGTGGGGGWGPLFGFSGCWVGPSKAEDLLLSLHASLWFRVELILKHRRPENSLVHTVWSRFLFPVGINSLCEQIINVCVRTSRNSTAPLV